MENKEKYTQLTESFRIKTAGDAEFESIAQNLFENWKITSGEGKEYRLVEIEFYWYKRETHEDNSTYKRIHVTPKAGDWFFHYSGVDIALDDGEGGYGGILIRGMYAITENKIVKGPQVCAMKLFSCINAFSESVMPHFVPHKFEHSTITATERKGLGDNAKTNGMNQKIYNFSINPTK